MPFKKQQVSATP